MKKPLVIVSGVLAVVVIVMSICYANLKGEHEWLQNNIDHNFHVSYSELVSDLMTIHLNPDMSEQEYQFFYEKVSKSGDLADTLVSMSSYRENAKLSSLVGMLNQASGTQAFYTLNMTEELDKKLRGLNGHFTDEEMINEVYELVKNSIVEND